MLKLKLNRNNLIIIVLTSGLVALVLQLYLLGEGFLTPMSSLFNVHPPFLAMFNEFAPLVFLLLIISWMNIENMSKEAEQTEKDKNYLNYGLLIPCFVLISLIFIRVWDITAMFYHPHNIDNVFIQSNAEIWMRIFFFCASSILLLTFFTLSYGKKGFKSLFTVSIIPAFYTLNTDIILYAGQIQSFSFFKPIYQLILEYGRFETLALNWFLNLFGFSSACSVNTFPYRLILGGRNYLINLPCIGWEGVVGYTIIFIAFLQVLNLTKRKLVIWAILGFIGTLFVNLIRLAIIMVSGALWGASVADLIHLNAGDIIFLIWILVFFYIVNRFTEKK